MAKMRYVKLVIKRNVMEGIARTVPAYEAPILEAMHGGDKLTTHGTAIRECGRPDVKTEFARLARLYGEHEKSGLPMVEYVYGRPTTGALEKAIDASIEHRKPRETAVA